MLSSIAHDDEYDVLLRNFANKIINGTADKKATLSVLRDENTPENLKIDAINILKKETKVSEETLELLRAQWQGSSSKPLRTAAIKALLKQASIPEEDLDAAMSCLQNGDKADSKQVYGLLSRPSPMTERVSRVLIIYLKNLDFQPARIVPFSDSPELVQEYILQTLRDADRCVRLRGTETLSKQSRLPESAIDTLTTRMIEDVEMLSESRQPGLYGAINSKDEILNILVTQMKEDHSKLVRYYTGSLLSSQKHLPDAALDAVISQMMEGVDGSARSSATQTLARKNHLPERAFDALIARITEDTDRTVRYSAARVLGGHTHLPNRAYDALIASMKKDPERSEAVYALVRATHLPDKALEAMIDHVTSDLHKYSRDAFQRVGRHTSTSNKLRDQLISLLDKMQDWDHRVIDALRLHQNLPEDVLDSFLHQLEEKQPSSQLKANIHSALWKHSTPSLFSSPKF
ncbi:hypothetical protein N7522_008306 [Penicillium canescens]|nr:hypothetical protein N7522_008306 [Penicillium canescens]